MLLVLTQMVLVQDGDLFDDTTKSNEHYAGNTQYDAVTSVGDFKLQTVSS